MIPFEWLEQAQQRIAPHIQNTPLTFDAQRGLYLKWDNRQVSGSFKVRGALNRILALEGWERAAGLVTASAGNHGQGVALAGGLVGAAVEVFVSSHAVPAKVQAMQRLGARLHEVEGGYAEAEAAARRYAAEQQKVFISPYNDGQVIAGQGTLGLEILREIEASAARVWVVPTGGGGLISAQGVLLARFPSRPRLVAVQAEASPFTYHLFRHGTQRGVPDRPTLADGLSGAIEADSVTLPLMRRYVDDFVLVSEAEIEEAVAFAWFVYHEKIEGSAAAGLAAVLSGKVAVRPALVILSGGNIQPEVHARIVAQYARRKWD